VNPEKRYKEALADFIGCKPDQFFLFWKGRVALYAALKAIGIQPGDEVIVPAFTCVVVPNAIIYLGAHPVYVDIDPKTLNTSLDLIRKAVTPKTKCILIQNTFGLSSEVDEIIAFAKEKQIPTIEDCTHGFGGMYKGKPNGVRSDFSFYSTQWNKPFSTGVGGILLVNNEAFLDGLRSLNEELVYPGVKSRIVLKLLIIFNKFFITDKTYWMLIRFYRFLSKTGLVVGSSSGEELNSPRMPANFFMGGCNVQFKEGVRSLRTLKEMIALRIKNAAKYSAFLKEHGKYFVDPELEKDHSFLKYPFLVKDRAAFIKKAEKASIRLGEWFESQIHPVHENFELWELTPENFPVSLEMSSHMLNLPTEIENSDKVISFLKQNLDDLL
jgi:dTDP-4-amino-4,6-dideoxygalactose transaminase